MYSAFELEDGSVPSATKTRPHKYAHFEQYATHRRKIWLVLPSVEETAPAAITLEKNTLGSETVRPSDKGLRK